MKFFLREGNHRAVRTNIVRHLATLTEDRPWVVEVKQYRRNRSLEQNKQLHKMFSELSQKYYEATGEMYVPGVWKEYYKESFGVHEVLQMPDGLSRDVLVSTAKYDTRQMSKFIEDICHHAGSEFSIGLTMPGDT